MTRSRFRSTFSRSTVVPVASRLQHGASVSPEPGPSSRRRNRRGSSALRPQLPVAPSWEELLGRR